MVRAQREKDAGKANKINVSFIFIICTPDKCSKVLKCPLSNLCSEPTVYRQVTGKLELHVSKLHILAHRMLIITKAVSAGCINHIRYGVCSPLSMQNLNFSQSAYQLVCGGGGVGGMTWPLSVLNYGRFNHHFCTVSVVEVLHRLGNLTTGLGDKIIQSLFSYVAKLCVSHSQRQLVVSGGRRACHFLSLTTADLIILFAQHQLWKSQKCWKT